MRILVHGNSPNVPTGYGVQIGQLMELLRADGHEVACSSTYGVDGMIENWHGFRIYGRGYDTYGNDRLHMHAAHWFGEEAGLIVTVMDVWAIKNPVLRDFNVAAWTPIDHATSLGAQSDVKEFFARTDAIPVAMSRFGEEMLRIGGLSPEYVPLSVDMDVYKPTPTLKLNGETKTAREIHGIPDDAFLVGMVAMNKGWAKDRKGFGEAFQAFAYFENDHKDAWLYVHADAPGGMEGINLTELAVHCGIPPHKIVFAGGPTQYGYYIGYEAHAMAALYTTFDVLLAPSHGEGFCVPLIEAQACGTPVIATRYSAQLELVPDDCGWLVEGQQEWDAPHHGFYKVPFIVDVLDKLEEAYKADRQKMAPACMAHAAQYEMRHVYDTYWRPLLASLVEEGTPLELDRQPMPAEHAVAVLCPIHKRTKHVHDLAESFRGTVEPGEATLYLVYNEGDADEWAACESVSDGDVIAIASPRPSFAAKLNVGFDATDEPWVLCIGDDVRFHPGWLTAARALSGTHDVIGTNDTAGQTKNPKVANGSHADHFFVRRAYVDEYGGALEGPGVLAPEAYRHWFTDMEIVGLARARGVFSPCLASVVEHLHPGYDGDEAARLADPTYMAAVAHAEADERTYLERLPLIEQQRMSRLK